MTTQSYTRKFRLLFVTPEYPPNNIGGGGKVVQTLARQIAKQAEVLVLSGKFKVNSANEGVRKDTDTGVELYWLPLLPQADEYSPLSTYMPPNMRSMIFLANTILKGNFDIIHLHGFGHLLVDLAAALCVLSRHRYVITVHGFPVISSRRKLLGFLYSVYSRSIGKLTLKLASRVVGVSKKVAQIALQHGANIRKLRVIYNGIDRERPRDFRKGHFRKKFGIAKNEYMILCIGRIIWQKGFQFIVRAFPSIIKEAPDTWLILIGKNFGFGSELKRLSRDLGVDDRIVYTGFVDDSTYHQALVDADILVIPSLVEPFSLVAVEGLAYSKPIVASQDCGFTEIMSNGTVLLVNPQDTDQMKSAVIRVIKNRNLRQKLSHDAKKELRKFSSKSMIRHYLQLYRKLLQSS